MTDQALDEWDEMYDNRFALKLRRGEDTIKLARPQNLYDGLGRAQYEVIAYIGDEVFHTTHQYEQTALERVAVCTMLAEHEVEFEVGDDVFAVSSAFDPVVQHGTVVRNDEHRSVGVRFEVDPFVGAEQGQRFVGVDPDELIHADADAAEVLTFIGQTDVLEPADFEVQGDD